MHCFSLTSGVPRSRFSIYNLILNYLPVYIFSEGFAGFLEKQNKLRYLNQKFVFWQISSFSTILTIYWESWKADFFFLQWKIINFWSRRACVRHPLLRMKRSWPFISPTLFFLSFFFFFLRVLLFTHFGKTPVTENLFPPIFWNN